MIRILLPAHLRSLARCEREVSVESIATQRAVVDALEQRFPVLRGTMRDPHSGQRRAYGRFFGCEQDLSHDLPDAPLPDGVAEGQRPFVVLGAMAGG